MEKSPNDSKSDSIIDKLFHVSTSLEQILIRASSLIVFGGVVIILLKFNIIIDPISHLDPTAIDPIALAGGAIVLVALTFIGIPLIPAAVAGGAIWLLIQKFFPQ